MLLRHLLPGDADAKRNRESRHPDSRTTSLVTGLNARHACLLASAPAGMTVAENTGEVTPVLPLPCRIVDTSENGMRLAWDECRTGDARVGDLLGIVDDGHRLQLVITRSVKIHREGGMELGVQKIHGSCGPVYCRGHDDNETEDIRALFITSSEEDGMSATLVMAKGFYAAGRHLQINSFGREVQARAGRNVSDSPVFDRFEFAADDSGS